MKKTILALALIVCSGSAAFAETDPITAENNTNSDKSLENFYVGAKLGLGFYTASGIHRSGIAHNLSPYFGYNFKELGVPVRAELSYQTITGGGVNGYYDLAPFMTRSEKAFTPYITVGIASFGFNAGAGVRYFFDNRWSTDVGARFSTVANGLVSFSAITANIGFTYHL